MAERPRLEIVDDPVMRVETPAPPKPDSHRRGQAASAAAASPASSATDVSAEQPARPKPESAPAAQSFRGEEKRAVFGRVPRSLSRRLERAVVELREDMDDLTQEQVLAALLHRYVHPAETDRLRELEDTVRAYREQL